MQLLSLFLRRDFRLRSGARYRAGILLLLVLIFCPSCHSSLVAPPTATVPPPVLGAPLFEEVAEKVGISFHHFTGATGNYLFPEIAGPGVALLDYDNDGALDILVMQGNFLEPGKTLNDAKYPLPSGWKPGCRLYRNRIKETGKLEFEDVTEKAGLHFIVEGMGVAVGDYDNDGYPDLFLTGFGKCALYHNNGNGTFTDVTREAGIAENRWATSATFVDYDRDGWLDLCVAHYVDYTVKADVKCSSSAGERDYCGPRSYRGVASALYHSRGRGPDGKVRFEAVSEKSGIGSKVGAGLGVVAADFDGDGWPDLLISNDEQANYLWLNQHNGTFKETALAAGVAYNSDGKAQANMGLAVGDFNGTGRESILVTHLPEEGVVLYQNDGKGLFHDVEAQYSLLQGTLGSTGFGAEWLDYDNDGWLDLFVANGAVRVREEQRAKLPYPFLERNDVFHNEGPGKPFRKMSQEAGPALKQLQVGRGLAVGDLENNGALDVVISTNNGPLLVLVNRAIPPGRHWLEVRLEGVRSNRGGIGAQITLVRAGKPTQYRRVHTDGSYCSASDIRAHFGLGESTQVQALQVEWPSGIKEKFRGILADRLITLKEGSGTPQ